MSDQVTGTFGTKQIHELIGVATGKLHGKELLLIDLGDGQETMNVTVDTLLGYIRDQINNTSGGGGTTPTVTGSTIHIIPEGEDIPEASREKGHYYIRVVEAKDVQASVGPTYVKVSPNMGLKMMQDYD